jgi:tRNA nucleotidyltransferase (CCA-adding enzyme)
MSSWIPEKLRSVLAETPELRRAFLVGGSVRDWLLGIPVKDFDVEVYGLSYEELSRALGRWGRTDLVGRSFGVVKLSMPTGVVYDFSIPRRDSKVAPGHKGFEITFDPEISPREAAARRDFTINSLMYDPRGNELLDFFGGQRDLQNRILRHTSEAFVEDPLRVLRGMQFAARFQLTAAPETVALARSIKSAFNELAPERVREEWFKWAAKSTLPSAGLRFLAATEWLDHFPEIKAMQGTPQDPEWHPEGDVFVHTCHCCDALVQLPEWQQADEETKIVLSLAVLAHDFGKAVTTEKSIRDGQERIVSPGHEEVGVDLAERFLQRTHAPGAIVERVGPLIRNHMAHVMTITDRSVRRLSKRIEPETIFDLCVLMTADSMGRPPRPPQVPAIVTELRAKAAELEVQNAAPKPILMGRHLLQLGMSPGPQVGAIVNQAYDAQLEGKFFTLPEAHEWLLRHSGISLPENVRRALDEKPRMDTNQYEP